MAQSGHTARTDEGLLWRQAHREAQPCSPILPSGTLASFLPSSISMAICFENTSVIFILSLLEA
jgi:hypothetical protein